MKTFQEVLNYISKHEPKVKRWPQSKFERWVRWYWSEGLICLSVDDNDDIVGLAMIRPVLHPDDAIDPCAHDQEGEALYLAEVISTAPGALQSLGFAALKRFGIRKFVVWQRGPDWKLRVHKFSALRRNLLRMGVHST